MESYTSWVFDLAKFHHRSPDQLGNPEISAWLLHLIQERKLSASSVNVAINSLRSFYGRLLGRDLEPLLVGIKRPARRIQPPRVFSAEEVERLITVGTAGDPLARVFLMMHVRQERLGQIRSPLGLLNLKPTAPGAAL